MFCLLLVSGFPNYAPGTSFEAEKLKTTLVMNKTVPLLAITHNNRHIQLQAKTTQNFQVKSVQKISQAHTEKTSFFLFKEKGREKSFHPEAKFPV